MKKIISVLTMLCLVMGLAVFASAANTGVEDTPAPIDSAKAKVPIALNKNFFFMCILFPFVLVRR